jgi:DNA-directed RNA polymerase specialized sigma subunit
MRKKVENFSIPEKELKEILFELYVLNRWSFKRIAEYLGTTEWQIVQLAKRFNLNIRRLSSIKY